MSLKSEAQTFFGRDAERAAIAEMLGEVVARRAPAGLLIVGDAGRGKSRLLEEAGAAFTSGQRFAIVGYEPERNVPLAAASSLLRSLTAGEPAGTTLLEPVRIFEAAHAAVDRLGPVLLTIDDLQWVDELSLALCHYLVRAATAPERPVGLVAAARPSTVTNRFLGSMDQLLGSTGRFRVIELGPLDVRDAVALLTTLDPSIDEERAVRLWALTGGSPFWLEAVAQASHAGIDTGELITRRLRGLSGDAATALATLAAAAKPVSIGDLARLADWSTGRAEEAAAVLVGRDLAVSAPGGVSFSHDLIRDAALSSLPASTQARLHRRLAALLEEDAAGDVQALRAALEHRRAGGLPTIDLALRLATSPRRRWLGAAGLRELATIAGETDLADPQTEELREAVASLAAEVSDHQLAYELWTQLADATGDDPRRCRALLAAATAAYALDRRAEARACIARCRDVPGVEPGISLALDALEAQLTFWFAEGQLPEGRRLAYRVVQRARRMARAAGGPELLGGARRAYIDALSVGYFAALQTYDTPATTRLADEMIVATRGFDEAGHLSAVFSAAQVLREGGRLHDAEARVRGVWNEARSRLLFSAAIDAGYTLAKTLRDLGRLDEAASVGVEAAAITRRTGEVGRLRVHGWLVVNELEFSRSDWRQTAGSLAERVGPMKSAHEAQTVHQTLGRWLARLGGQSQEATALQHVTEGRRLAHVAGCPRCRLENELVVAETFLRLGRPSEARAALAGWDRERPSPNPQDAFERKRIGALLETTGGPAHASAEALAAVLDEADRQDRRFQALWTRLDLARVLATFDRARAADELRAAAREAELMGARNEAALAEQALRALGVRTWRRGPGPLDTRLDALTERELDIARLVAAGASNPEIAGQLFLSRKTVERHVTNILAKVGARNRTELAAILPPSPSPSR